MKALIISDSHGRANDVMNAIELVKPDTIFHLGDGANDCRGLGLMYPDISLYQVGGNCDFTMNMEAVRMVKVQGVKILMTHGHVYKVKQGLELLLRTAKKREADVVLYGHTHTAFYEERDGMTVINPGSIGYSGRYGVLIIENGKVSYKKGIL